MEAQQLGEEYVRGMLRSRPHISDYCLPHASLNLSLDRQVLTAIMTDTILLRFTAIVEGGERDRQNSHLD
jgi:hypothetical protein